MGRQIGIRQKEEPTHNPFFFNHLSDRDPFSQNKVYTTGHEVLHSKLSPLASVFGSNKNFISDS